MFYPSSIHTHTQFCDGKNTMAEMVEEALSLGLRSLAFTPHSPLPYENDWAMREDDYPAFFAEYARLKADVGDRLALFSGIEWDSQTDTLPEGLFPVIGAVHSLVRKGECFAVDYAKDLLQSVIARLYDGDVLELAREYFAEYEKAAKRPRVDIAAHLDLITKYNKDGEILNENDPEYLRLAENCIDGILSARPDIYFEINTGVIARAGKKDPYPAPALLHRLTKKGARLVLTCDCHRTAQMCAGYDRARELLSECPASPRLFILEKDGFAPYKL